MSGEVVSINITDREGEPTFLVDEAEVVEGMGLRGDRLFNKAESASETVEPHRQVTLIEAEVLEALKRDHDIDLTAEGSRRNICTRGIGLNDLVGRDIRVGEAVLRGMEPCEPCRFLERISGHEGLVGILARRGGLRAEVRRGGTIRPGDVIEPA